MHTAGVGKILDPIQAYCQAQRLPPLTALVVQKSTGLPGVGFTAAQAVQVASDQASVFDFDWLAHGNPQVKGLQDTALPVLEGLEEETSGPRPRSRSRTAVEPERHPAGVEERSE